MYFSYKGFLFKELSFELLFIPLPTKLPRDIVTLSSVRHILVHTLSLRESGTLLIFKVVCQRSRSQAKIFTA